MNGYRGYIKLVLNIVLLFIFALPLLVFLFPSCQSAVKSHSLNPHLEDILRGIIASFTFLIIVFLVVKPSIVISDEISRVTDENAATRFKIVNLSLFRAYDINVFIYRVDVISGRDIQRTLLAKIQGVDQGCPYLQSAAKAIFEQEKTNAWQLKTNKFVDDKEIDKALNQTSYLELHLTVKHGLSGLQGSFVKEFRNKYCIKDGYFRHGFGISISRT